MSARQRVLVVGGGVAGLLHAQLVLDRATEAGQDVEVVWAVWRDASMTASRSGGLAMPYAAADPRVPGWAARAPQVGRGLVQRHPELRPYLREIAAVVVSAHEPTTLAGGAGQDTVDPAGWGLPHRYGRRFLPGPLWHTCALLPVWSGLLAADRRVRRVDLGARLAGGDELLVLHDEHAADVTLACLGLGAHALGDDRMQGRLGVLLTGPLPGAGVHRAHALIDDDDPLLPRYTLPHATGPGAVAVEDHLHVGGTYLPVDDPAEWDEPGRLAQLARSHVPRLLADARDSFPALADWEPWSSEPWWGLRPVREQVALGRLEPGATGGRTVVVDHGWGGSGWTIGPAVADEVAEAVVSGAVGSLPVWAP